MESEVEVRCPECGSRELTLDDVRGETACYDCGLVLTENRIDPEGKRIGYTEAGQSLGHVGAPTNVMMPDGGLSTSIPWQNRDYAGRTLDSKARTQFHRLRKWQGRGRVSNSMERNLVAAFSELDRLSGVLGLGRGAKEESAVIYRKCVEGGLVRGRSIDAMVAASVYLANQKLHLTRSLDSIVNATRCSRKEISRAHKIIKSALGVRTRIPEPGIYVGRLCTELELPMEVQRRTHIILEEATDRELTHGRSPMGVAAAAIYIAGRMENYIRTQREIADVSDVTEVTIRNRYKELVHELGYNLE